MADGANEGYTVIRDALKQTGKVAIGQLHHAWPRAPSWDQSARAWCEMLSILRYGNEVRAAEPSFDELTARPTTELHPPPCERVDQANEWTL